MISTQLQEKLNAKAAAKDIARLKEINELTERKDHLVERLDAGAVRIEEARAKRQDTNDWESYWCGLLKEYEQVCDKLRLLNKAQ